LTSKGFAVVEVRLSETAAFDLYDLHMDAGGAAEDMSARAAQVEQLLTQLAARSAGRAVVVAGDTNMRASEDSLQRLLAEGKLTDSCRALSCGDERIDRIFFRNSTNLSFEPSRWRTADEFVDGSGQPLSDHLAVAVDFAWQAL
jgi:endonuclease/exonuclease/phosphatase family metal-dependent hydrolase